MLEIRCKHRSRIDNSRVPNVFLSFIPSFLPFFLSFFLHSFSFPLSLSLSHFFPHRSRVRVFAVACVAPQGFLIQAFPIHPPTHNIHWFKIQRPSSLKPFVHSLVLLCPPSSALLFLPSHQLAHSLLSYAYALIFSSPINYFIKPFIGRSFILFFFFFFFSFGETFE